MDYTPDRGDFVWIWLSPQVGHEQAEHRPALVLSPQSYNSRIGLALFCPVTSQMKGYPFEVKIPSGLNVSGVILGDQIRSMDWRGRHAQFICKAPEDVVEETLKKLDSLLR